MSAIVARLGSALVGLALLCAVTAAEAGTGWHGTLYNDIPNATITQGPGGNDCWYADDFGTPHQLQSNNPVGEYNETKNQFGECYYANHYSQGFNFNIPGIPQLTGSLNMDKGWAYWVYKCTITVGTVTTPPVDCGPQGYTVTFSIFITMDRAHHMVADPVITSVKGAPPHHTKRPKPLGRDAHSAVNPPPDHQSQ